MYKIIGGDRNEYGPVSADELQKWVAERRVNAQTMVKLDGAADWKPLSSFPEFAAALGGGVPPSMPAPPALSSPGNIEDPSAYAAEIIARGVTVQIGSCIGRSWNLIKGNLVVTAVSYFLIFLTIMSIGFIGAFIPFLGNILGAILQGVLMGGYFWLLLKLIRGEEAEIVDAFSGFNLAFVQLMLTGIVTTILAALPVFIAVVAFMGSFFMTIFSPDIS